MLRRIQENVLDSELERLLAWMALGPDDEDPDDDEDDGDEDQPKGPPVNN